MFETLNQLEPSVYQVQSALAGKVKTPVVDINDWRKVRDSIRNFIYQNFNPGVRPQEHRLRREIFENMSSTSGLFLALEPQVFVSKIRCRVFRNWKAAEDYYSNSLREAKFALAGEKPPEHEIEDDDELISDGEPTAALPVAATPASATKSQSH